MDAIYAKVGERIRAQRRQRSLTLEDLAEMSGLHASYIGQIERGAKKCSLRTVAALAEAMGLGAGKLFGAGAMTAASYGLDAAVSLNSPAERLLLLELVRSLSKGLRKLRS